MITVTHCNKCKGDGSYLTGGNRERKIYGPGGSQTFKTCSKCNGTGHVVKEVSK